MFEEFSYYLMKKKDKLLEILRLKWWYIADFQLIKNIFFFLGRMSAIDAMNHLYFTDLNPAVKA